MIKKTAHATQKYENKKLNSSHDALSRQNNILIKVNKKASIGYFLFVFITNINPFLYDGLKKKFILNYSIISKNMHVLLQCI